MQRKLLLILATVCCVEALYPVILIPGDGGSQLFARLNKTRVPSFLCSKRSDGFFPIWFNLRLIFEWWTPCFADNLKLVYDPVSHRTSDAPGVEIRIEGFGTTDPVEWLDHSHFFDTTYFYQIAQGLVDQHGYVRGKNIRGAPFDFRKGPNELEVFYQNLTLLVEETYRVNNNTPVVLLGHSYGNPILWVWLTRRSQEWKDRYIQSWINLSGPMAGAVKGLRMFVSGDDLDLFPINPLTLRVQQRTMPSSAFLLPSPHYWSQAEVLVSRPGHNYTAADYKRLFSDLGLTDAWSMAQDQSVYMQQLKPPNVKLHVVHGVGVNTPAAVRYSESQWPNGFPDTLMGPGDGSVNIRSLHAPLVWRTQQRQEVTHVEIPGASHLGILENKDAIAYIGRLASQG